MRAKSGARAARGGSSHGDEDEPPSQASHSDRSSPGSGAGSPHAGVSAPGGGGAALAEGGSEGDADDGSAEGDEGSASDAAAGAGGDNNSPHHHQDQPSQAPPPHHQAQQDLPAAQSFTSPSHAPRNDRVGQLRAAGDGEAPLTPNSYMTGNTSMFLTPSPTRLPPVVGPTLEDLQQAQTQAEQAQANMETVMRDGQPAAVDASASGGDDSMVDDARNIAMQQLFYAYDEYVLSCVCACVCVAVVCGCVCVCVVAVVPRRAGSPCACSSVCLPASYTSKLRLRIEADRVHMINIQTAELELAARAGSAQRHRDSDAGHAVSDLMDENDALTINLNAANAELEGLKVRVSELEHEATVSQQEIDSLQQAVQTHEDRYFEAADGREEALARVEELEAELATLRAAAPSADASVVSAATDGTATSAAADLARLQAQVSAVESTLESLRSEERRVVSNMAEYRSQEEAQHEACKTASQAADAARKELADLRKQHAAAKERLKRVMATGDQTQDAVAALQVRLLACWWLGADTPHTHTRTHAHTHTHTRAVWLTLRGVFACFPAQA